MKWCYPKTFAPNEAYLQHITNEEDAQTACTNNVECKMFYDVGAQHQQYGFCFSRDMGSSLHHSAISSTLYIKCKRFKTVDKKSTYNYIDTDNNKTKQYKKDHFLQVQIRLSVDLAPENFVNFRLSIKERNIPNVPQKTLVFYRGALRPLNSLLKHLDTAIVAVKV